ncbi:MAG TPA: hypothetical protein PKA77_04060 [Chitinophagaceae bacterium]|jgi:hypothetical protein|nr:hypothetical protein [Chitinophagaceae bacterium]HMU57707.1 hypothetical protein [Chitinophagaceae bacterium]
MEAKAENPKEIIRSMRIVHAALCVGVFLMAFVLFILVQSDVQKINSDSFSGSLANIPFLLSLAIATAFFVLARILLRKKLQSIISSVKPVAGKLIDYRTALIRYLALCEGPALLSVILFFVSGDYRLYLITGIMLAAMLWMAPSVKRIINDLQLSWTEQQEIE